MTEAASGRAAISTPFWDGVMTGGLSIVAMAAILAWLFFAGGPVDFVDGDWLVLLILVNSTHFMASYRLLYVGREQILGNPWSTIGVPIGLVGLLLWAAFGSARDDVVAGLVFASSVYLAWHYTGQAWGMVSAHGRLCGLSIETPERRAIRGGMRTLLALHVLFALSGRLPPASWVEPARYVRLYNGAFLGVCVVAGLSLLAGAWAYWRIRRRAGRLPLRTVFPWLALYLWYPFWYFVPGGFLWVQLSHALQYLAFPLRVEVNRYAATTPRTPAQRRGRVLLVFAGLVVLGTLVLHGPPLAAWTLGEGFYSTADARALFVGFTACVAIHHYFIDGAVWKLRNPEVRRELFSHLERERRTTEEA